ncbi:Txe/YoeB family addiction module toxin [Mucilaginibacter auburnensis]|uniref:Putative mRNA interferase YoeB n=1 Tax=Mucilaginibacter auburnensis TaxID=1457233 RepID=A0A2H9VPC9_9SPHI|nr:Txe/YoeB family addiction module toxin [Mucilaginibacter auburnensis]PJJ80209.1 toxin YoeB [Mucilaginibacter auburnensis]
MLKIYGNNIYPKALADLNDWQRSGNIKIQNKIKELLQSIIATPFSGVGKSEALKHNLSGKWSRRINKEHRIIYGVIDVTIYVYSLKGHY